MPAALSCPPVSRLRDLMLGFVGGEEHTILEQHVLVCAACTSAIEELSESDGLADALRQAGSARVPSGNLVERAIERACQLGVQAQASGCVDTDDAVAETAGKKHATRPEVMRLVAQVLGPAKSADELGWLGPYRVLQVLGHGGMGLLFLAEDGQLQRRVALKVMQPGLAASPEARKRFLREGRAVAALKHDNVVTVYHVGEDRGVFWLAMELLEGEPLDRCLKKQGRLPIAEAARIGREVAEALAAAHGRGVIHRDIKPGNIFLESPKQRVKVLDFGLARAAQDEVELTGTGDVLGTPAYMSPEQARGDVADHRSDLFSLGCVLYRMIGGKAPFGDKDTMGTLLALATQTPEPVRTLMPDVPAELDELITRLLAKDPAERPQTATEAAHALATIEALVAGRVPPPAPPVMRAEFPALDTSRQTRRFRPRISRLALIAAAATIVGGLMLAAVLLKVTTPAGTIVVEIDQPEAVGAEVSIDGRQRLTIKTKDSREPIRVVADEREHSLKVEKGGFETYTRQFTVKAGKSETIRVRLEPRGLVTGSKEAGASTAAGAKSATLQSPAPIDADRDLVPWLHEHGVNIIFAQNVDTGEFFGLPAGSELPPARFVVKNIEIVNASRITANEIDRLVELRLLTDLGVSGSALGVEAVPHLARLDYVKHLYLGRANLRSSDLSDLKQMPFLYLLHLNGNLLDDDGAVLRSFPALREVLITGSRPVKLTRLMENPGLRTVRLPSASVNIDEVTQLQQKNAYCRVITGSGSAMRALGRDPLREAAGKLLARGVELRGGPIGAQGGQKLTQAMLDEDRPYNVTEMVVPADLRLSPEDLRLVPYLFGPLDVVDAKETSDADKLAAALAENQVYWNIDFAKSDLTDAGLKHLQGIGGLEILNVRNSRISRAAAEAFHAAVPRCQLTTNYGVFKPWPAASATELARTKSPNLAVESKGTAVRGGTDGSAAGTSVSQSTLGTTGLTALDFSRRVNGMPAYVDTGALVVTGEPLTVEMFVTPRTIVRGQVPLFKTDGQFVLNLRQVVDEWNWSWWDFTANRGSELATPDVVLGKRTYLAAVSTGVELRLFVEGQLRGKQRIQANIKKETVITRFGSPWSDYQPWDGTIDDARISKIARYHSDFSPPRTLEADTDTIALYHFDEGQGNILVDSSGHRLHGKIFGARWVGKNAVPSPEPEASTARVVPQRSQETIGAGHALEFNGQDSFVNLPVKYDGSHPLTLEMTVLPYQGETRAILLSNNESKAGILLCSPTGCTAASREPDRTTVLRVFIDGAGATNAGLATVPPFQLNRPMHVAGILDGPTAKVFIGGKLIQTVSLPKPHPGVDAPFVIGANPAANATRAWYFGIVDELRMSKIARYTADFAPAKRFEPDKDTLALYHFDEGQGEMLTDSSGNRYHGKIVNAKWVPGVAGLATASQQANAASRSQTAGEKAPRGVSKLTFTGHEGKVSAVLLVPQRNLMLTGGNSMFKVQGAKSLVNHKGTDNTVRFWDLQTGAPGPVIKDGLGWGPTSWQIQGLTLSPDGNQIAVASCRPGADFCEATVTVWKLDNQERQHHFALPGRPGVKTPWFDLDGRTLHALRHDTTLHKLDLTTGKEISAAKLDPLAAEGALTSVCRSADRKLIYGGMTSGVIEVWSVNDGKKIQELRGHSAAVRSICVSSDGKFLASASDDRTARIWDLAQGQWVRQCDHDANVSAVAFAGGNQRIVTGDDAGGVSVWKVESGSRLKRFEGHTDAILCLAVSPDGRLLATGSADKTARTWVLP